MILLADNLPSRPLMFSFTSHPIQLYAPTLFPTYLDEAAREQPRLSVSAGVRGCQVILATEALMACTRASFAPLCR